MPSACRETGRPNLKSLTFVALPKIDTDPVVIRRKEVVARLTTQKSLALDPKFVRTVKIKGVEQTQKVHPMWKALPDGSYAFVLRVGFKPIEFAPGKPAIAVPSLDKLPDIIDALIAAVRDGSLDDKIAPVKKPRKAAWERMGAAFGAAPSFCEPNWLS
jgi:hypothetical protein